MRKLFLFVGFLITPLAAELFYGNPTRECPPPFRIYATCNYLYWQASEGNLEYVMKQRSSNAFGVQATVSPIDYPFKNGFRLGGGMVFPNYDWRVEANWTRFYNYLMEQRTSDASTLIALWMNPIDHAYVNWRIASFSWDLKFDSFDLDLLRVGFTNANFSFSPRIGLKRAWIKQSFHVFYGQTIPVFYDVRFSNDFRAIGPRIGFDTQLWAKWGLNLAASGSCALVYGCFRTHRTDVSNQYVSIDVLESVDRFRPMAQGSISLEWAQCFSCNSIRLQLGLGYDAEIWWGQNQLRTFVSSTLPSANVKTSGALTLKGLDFHARFDF